MQGIDDEALIYRSHGCSTRNGSGFPLLRPGSRPAPFPGRFGVPRPHRHLAPIQPRALRPARFCPACRPD